MANNGCIHFQNSYLSHAAATVGKHENEGPLRSWFDAHEADEYFGKSTFEQAESELVRRNLQLLLQKANVKDTDIGAILGGDLVNQCTGTSFGVSGSVFGIIRRLLDDCGRVVGRLRLGQRRVFAECGRGGVLAFLHSGASVPFSARVRQSASPHGAEHGDGRRGVFDHINADRYPRCGRGDRQNRGRRHYGRKQHGCGDGTCGGRHDSALF